MNKLIPGRFIDKAVKKLGTLNAERGTDCLKAGVSNGGFGGCLV